MVECLDAKIFIKKESGTAWEEVNKSKIALSTKKKIEDEFAGAVDKCLMDVDYSGQRLLQQGLVIGGAIVLFAGVPSALRLASSRWFAAIPTSAGLILLSSSSLVGVGMRLSARADVEGPSGKKYFDSTMMIQDAYSNFKEDCFEGREHVGVKVEASNWSFTFPVWVIEKGE